MWWSTFGRRIRVGMLRERPCYTVVLRNALATVWAALQETPPGRVEERFQPLAWFLCIVLGCLAVGPAAAGVLSDVLWRGHHPVESFEDVDQWGAMPNLRLCGNNVTFAFAAAWADSDACGWEGRPADLALDFVEAPGSGYFKAWWPSGCVEVGTSGLRPRFGAGGAACNNLEVAVSFDIGADASLYWVSPVFDKSWLGSLPINRMDRPGLGTEMFLSKTREITLDGGSYDSLRARRNGQFTIVNMSRHWRGFRRRTMSRVPRTGYSGADPFSGSLHYVDVFMGFNHPVVHTVKHITLLESVARRIAGLGGSVKLCAILLALPFVRKWALTESQIERDRLTLRGYQRLPPPADEGLSMAELRSHRGDGAT